MKNKIFLLSLVLILFSSFSCASMINDLNKAKKADTYDEYKRFTSKHPDSEYTPQIEKRMQEIRSDLYNLDKRIRVLFSSEQKMEKSVFNTENGYQINIKAHLLKNYSPSDNSPYVRGAYTSKDKLTRYVKERIAEICRVIYSEKGSLNISGVLVTCCHGIRVTYYGDYTGTHDEAWNLYQVYLSKNKAALLDWNNAKVDDIANKWYVRRNIIPRVQFQQVY